MQLFVALVFACVVLIATAYYVGLPPTPSSPPKPPPTSATHPDELAPPPPPPPTRPPSLCSNPTSIGKCVQSRSHGWCMDRQGKGRCVAGFLDGPFDPGVHCANWWFQGRCLNGPLCRRTDVVPQPSVDRGSYHHPAPYYYRNMPWNDGEWCGGDRCYDEPVVLAKVKHS